MILESTRIMTLSSMPLTDLERSEPVVAAEYSSLRSVSLGLSCGYLSLRTSVAGFSRRSATPFR